MKTITFAFATKDINYPGVNRTNMWRACTLKMGRRRWKNLKKVQRSGKIFHVHGLEKPTIVKNVFYNPRYGLFCDVPCAFGNKV